MACGRARSPSWAPARRHAQQTPRKGGTLRMTAPYAASFGSLDPHVTPRAQDDIVGKALQRTLYNWNTAANKLVLELAKSVSASADGLTYTYKLRDDAYFHNGRKMTADDIIFSYTRIMDGSKGYPGARYVRLIKGAVDVEKGHGQGDLRPEEDRRLHARDDDHRPRRSRLLLLRRLDGDPAQGRSREGQLRLQPGRPRALQVQGAHPGLARRRRALRQVLQARQALRRQARGADHGRGRRARRRLPQQGDRHLDPGSGPVRRLPRRSAALEGHPGSGRDVHALDALEPERRSSRSRTSACARRSTTRSTPT